MESEVSLAVRQASLSLMDAADLLEENKWDEARERIRAVMSELHKVVLPDTNFPWL